MPPVGEAVPVGPEGLRYGISGPVDASAAARTEGRLRAFIGIDAYPVGGVGEAGEIAGARRCSRGRRQPPSRWFSNWGWRPTISRSWCRALLNGRSRGLSALALYADTAKLGRCGRWS